MMVLLWHWLITALAVGCGELANRISRERCGSFVTASYETVSTFALSSRRLFVVRPRLFAIV